MTSSSPAPAPVHDPRSRGGAPPSGELDPIVWLLAYCARCGSELAQPFRSQVDRDAWAVEHLLATGHTVSMEIDGQDGNVEAHTSVYLRRTDDGDGFKWLCMASGCVRWIGPYDTPQLALADWRGHESVTR